MKKEIVKVAVLLNVLIGTLGCSRDKPMDNIDYTENGTESDTVVEKSTESDKDKVSRLSDDILIPKYEAEKEEVELKLKEPILKSTLMEVQGDTVEEVLEGEKLEKKVEEKVEKVIGKPIDELERVVLGEQEYYLINKDTNSELVKYSMVSPVGIIMEVDKLNNLINDTREELKTLKEDKEELNISKENSEYYLKNTLYYMKDYISNDILNSGIGRLVKIHNDSLHGNTTDEVVVQLIIDNIKKAIEKVDTYDKVVTNSFYSNSAIGSSWIEFKNELENQNKTFKLIESNKDLFNYGDKLDSTLLSEKGTNFINAVNSFIGYNYIPKSSE